MLKRRKSDNATIRKDDCTNSSSSTSLAIEEESDGVDKDDTTTAQSIHTNTPIDGHDSQLSKNIPVQFQDPIFAAAMAHLHKEAAAKSLSRD